MAGSLSGSWTHGGGMVASDANVHDNVEGTILQQGLPHIYQRQHVSGFDPYLIWLDIPSHERPATYYRLLGLRPLENDPQVIASSAERVISHVARFQQSEHAATCTQLLAELSAARDCLLHPQRKQAYDSGISQSFTTPSSSSPVPQTPPPPGAAAERPLAGPNSQIPTSAFPQGEQPLSGPTQIPTGGERQISQSPPVPQLPMQTPAVPTTPQVPNTPGETPINAPGGVPQSVRPFSGAGPAAASQTPESPLPQVPQATTAATPYAVPPGDSLASGVPSSPATTPPPTWATGERTGEVSTVVAGQQGPETLDKSKTRKGRQLRRAQQAQSAYMLVGIAMAMVVFFFGAVLLIAIFLGGQ